LNKGIAKRLNRPAGSLTLEGMEADRSQAPVVLDKSENRLMVQDGYPFDLRILLLVLKGRDFFHLP
jgi:hypothetical protein